MSHNVVRPLSLSAHREGYSKCNMHRAITSYKILFYTMHYIVYSLESCVLYNFSFSVEFVNAQEPLNDMKSITDRAAQTLLWTELFRGQ